jgi:MFS family permease
MRARLHYGWLIGAVLFLGFVLTVGVTQYAFGVFVTELEDDLGWSRAAINGSLSTFAIAGLVAPLVGWGVDRVGARPVMALSLLAMAVSQLLRPWMTEVWQLYALSLLQFAGLPGLVMIPVGKLVAAWFEGARGRAMGLTSMGANVGGVFFASLSALLIGGIGWRASYFLFGVLFLVLVPVVLLVIRDAPPERVAGASGGDGRRAVPALLSGLTTAEALRSRAFYLVVVGLFLAQLTYLSVLTQIVPHLEDVGVSRGEAAAALSLLALFGAMGKVSFGWLTEKVPARYVVVLSLACQVIGIAILVAAGSSRAFWAFAPIFGLGFGALGALMPLLVQDTFGLRAFGTIFGLVNFFTLGAALIGPPLVGASFDASGSYAPAFVTVAALFVVAAVIIARARPPAGWLEAAPDAPTAGALRPAVVEAPDR